MCHSQSHPELSYSLHNQTTLKVEASVSVENTSRESRDSQVFYTPDGSSNTSEIFICSCSPSPEKETSILSNISNFQQPEQMFEPLISMRSTDFICNLNPPNSNFIIGSSSSRNGRLSLLPLPNISKPVMPINTPSSKQKHKNKQQKIRTKSPTTTSISNPAPNFLTRRNLNHEITLNPTRTSTPSSRKFCQTSATKSHSKNHISKSKYKCNLCANTYSLECWYLFHLQKHKDNSLYRCSSCDLSFPSQSVLKYHKPTHYSRAMLRRSKRNSFLPSSSLRTDLEDGSETCLSDIANSLPVSYKIQIENGESLLQISPESDRSLLNASLPVTSSNHSIAPNSKVKSLSKEAGSAYKLRSKSLETDAISSQKIIIPSKPDNGLMSSHKTPAISHSLKGNSSISKDFLCEICQRSFVSKHALNVHGYFHRRLDLENKNNVIPSASSLDKSNCFTNEENSSHGQSDSLADATCKICNKSFKTQRAMRIHCHSHRKNLNQTLDTHSHETQHPRINLRNASKKLSPCKLCECDSFSLIKHQTPRISNSVKTPKTLLTGDSNENPTKLFIDYAYTCCHCTKSFRFLKSYMRHLPSHNQTNPDTSNENDKINATRPFKCHQCIGRFGRRSGLKSHEIQHLNDKPFDCKHCPRTFATKSLSEAHIRVHTGEKPFGCSLCTMRYSHNCSLKTHFNKMHQEIAKST